MELNSWIYFDYIYDNFLISIFLNKNSNKTKKWKYEKNFYKLFFLIKIKLRENPYLIFFENIEKMKICISIKFKSKRARKKMDRKLIPIPILLKTEQQYKQVLKWLNWVLYLDINKIQFVKNLFYELINSYLYNESVIMNYKSQIFQYSVTNKYNNHYRW